MNMRLVLLSLCLVGMACALPAHRSKRSASSEDASHQARPCATPRPNKPIDVSNESNSHDSDSSKEVLPAGTTAVPSTESQTGDTFIADPFRGDKAGRGDSEALEIRAADDAGHSFEAKGWKSAVKLDTQDILNTTVEQADKPEDADKPLEAADDTDRNDASHHQDTTISTEHNSQEDSKQSQPDHSVEEDSHPDSHTSNESPETHASNESPETHPDHSVEEDNHASNESSETQPDHSVEEDNHASNESPETHPDHSLEVDNHHSSESPEGQPDHSVEQDKQPESHTSNESPEHHVLLRGLKQATPTPDTESSESSESQEDSLPHSSV
ncbi:protein starmaker-like [Ambystoma mexicanum]|uniref:protein starmaker-like n=1 Tax=Ambystoma mexicanum TaxID=8296 RepID=UPI0037E83174